MPNRCFYDDIWQALALLPPVQTVGVMGDARSYEHVCALRPVTSTDGMTAEYCPFPHDFLGRVATRIISEVRGINRVVYDVTSKPPRHHRVGMRSRNVSTISCSGGRNTLFLIHRSRR